MNTLKRCHHERRYRMVDKKQLMIKVFEALVS